MENGAFWENSSRLASQEITHLLSNRMFITLFP
jgi:hypothetical protein